MKQVTVKMLFNFCKKEIEKGNGNKNIVLSDDTEGNGYHGCYYGFTEIDKYTENLIYESKTYDKDNTIILG